MKKTVLVILVISGLGLMKQSQAQADGNPEALAFCFQNQRGYWLCDGPTQFANAGEEGDAGLLENLRNAGCKNPRLIGPSTLTPVIVARLGTQSGNLYGCGFQLKPNERNMRRHWSGLENMP